MNEYSVNLSTDAINATIQIPESTYAIVNLESPEATSLKIRVWARSEMSIRITSVRKAGDDWLQSELLGPANQSGNEPFDGMAYFYGWYPLIVGNQFRSAAVGSSLTEDVSASLARDNPPPIVALTGGLEGIVPNLVERLYAIRTGNKELEYRFNQAEFALASQNMITAIDGVRGSNIGIKDAEDLDLLDFRKLLYRMREMGHLIPRSFGHTPWDPTE